MTNAQLFSYPNVNLAFNKDLIAPNAIPNVEIKQIQIIWESLLDETNAELITTSLLQSVRFTAFVDKTRGKFKKDYEDLRKFPKVNDDDWK